MKRRRIPQTPVVKKDNREDAIGQISARALASYPKESFQASGLSTTQDLPQSICVYVMMDIPLNNRSHNSPRTYVGYTIDVAHRWRQHSRMISGGAKSTGRFVCCIPLAIMSGFPTRQSALQYEWRLKKLRLHKAVRHLPVFARREKTIVELFKLENATRSAQPLAEFRHNLSITWGCVPNPSTVKQLRQLGITQQVGLEWPDAAQNLLTMRERVSLAGPDQDDSDLLTGDAYGISSSEGEQDLSEDEP
jgi:predicted GIY-YIG superfamily endonuclease